MNSKVYPILLCFLKNYDIIVIARPGAKELPFLEFGSSIDHVLKRSKLMKAKRS